MPTVLIAVDFGTTYSGLAFSDPSKRSSEPIPISDWGRGVTSPKVPTEIQFEGNDSDKYKWGFQIKRGQERHTWFKLDLDPSNRNTAVTTSLSQSLSDRLASPPDYERTTEDIVAAYLTALRTHALNHIEKLYGNAVVKYCCFDWIITVPAVWSDAAKKKTREAALKAGMGNKTSLQMTSEPEAAAVYAMKALDPHHIKAGESIVICDAGGGTVDLITYKVKSTGHPFSVEESAIGGGSQCGSTFLNRRFEKFLDEKLHGKVIPENARAMAMNYFEKEAKRNFDAHDEDEDEEDLSFEVPLPGLEDDASAGIYAGFLEMSYADMKEVFRPVIDEILQLVNRQVKEASKGGPISAVILVGGFGESICLYRRIKESIRPIPLLQTPNAWTAVVRGAVMKGESQVSLDPGWVVKSRYCRGNYGVGTGRYWVRGMPEHRRVWCPYYGAFMVGDGVHWIVKRGDKIKESSSNTMTYKDHVLPGGRIHTTCPIYFSAVRGSQAPVYRDSCRALQGDQVLIFC